MFPGDVSLYLLFSHLQQSVYVKLVASLVGYVPCNMMVYQMILSSAEYMFWYTYDSLSHDCNYF